jgi:hypothetical protein
MLPKYSFLLVMLLLPQLLVAQETPSSGKATNESLHVGDSATAELVLTQQVEHPDVPAREPMIVEHPSGAQFVSGYGSFRPRLWKSVDHGATWTRVDIGSESQGAIGNSDCDLAVAPDGTLYLASLSFDRRAKEGIGIAVGVSRDIGATWSWTTVSKERFDDRPWIAVAPDGTAHLIWNDGSGVNHAVSRDRGVTWAKGSRVHDKGGSSHLATGPNGEVAVRIVPISAAGNKYDEGVDLLAVSVDGGTTWQNRPAPGQREWVADFDKEPGMIRRWVEPIAWDAQGALYSLWTDRTGIWLARSTDRAATWTQWRLAETTDLAHYPYLVARGKGELAAAWFIGAGENLRWRAARISVDDGSASPRIMESTVLRIDSWKAPDRPGVALLSDEAGEYLGITFLRDGGLAVVSPIQDWLSWHFGFSWWRFDVR